MFTAAMTLHVLATIVWVGGMFFMHMALRPAAVAVLEPPQRLPLMHQTLKNFFPWVWVAVITIIVSGYWIFLGVFHGKMGIYVHVMQGIGLLMAGLFFYLYFMPFRRLGVALAEGDLPRAGQQMNGVRRIVTINLTLGLLASIIAVAKPF